MNEKLVPAMMKRCFKKQCDSQKLVSKDGAKAILAAHLIPMNHPYVSKCGYPSLPVCTIYSIK